MFKHTAWEKNSVIFHILDILQRYTYISVQFSSTVLLPQWQSKKMTLLLIFHSRQLTYLDSDSPALLCPEVSIGPLGPVGLGANSNCFEKREFTLSQSGVLFDLQYLSNHRESLFCPWHPLLPPVCPFWSHSLVCLLSETSSVYEQLLGFTADIIFELNWIPYSSPQRRRTHMRMLTWSGRVWVGSLVCWRAADLGPPWTGNLTLHLRYAMPVGIHSTVFL